MIVLRSRSTLTVLMLKLQEHVKLSQKEAKLLDMILRYSISKDPDIKIKVKLFKFIIDGICTEADRQFLLAYLSGLEIVSEMPHEDTKHIV